LAGLKIRRIEEQLIGGEGFAVDASLIKADANRQKGIEGGKLLPPEAAGRSIDEYLAVLDDAAFGAATEVTPKFVSPSDPAVRWTGAHGRPFTFTRPNPARVTRSFSQPPPRTFGWGTTASSPTEERA
jgi:hypothetical protein